MMINVALTNDQEMGGTATFQMLDTLAVIEYLNTNPRHAVVVDRGDDQVAIWRGASDEPTNFYHQVLPLEEPDAEGGELTAGGALLEVVGADFLK